jgi:hypothetical protein
MAATVDEAPNALVDDGRRHATKPAYAIVRAQGQQPPGAALLALPAAALAEAIDGDWCRDDGRRHSVNGPDIVTPCGTRLQGTTTATTSVVPTPEPGAGGTVAMVPLSAILMHLKPPAGEEQTWRRRDKIS